MNPAKDCTDCMLGTLEVACPPRTRDGETCNRCGGTGKRPHRTNVVWGEGPTPCDVMYVGEAPGYQEDLHGRPFYPDAPAGRVLRSVIDEVDLPGYISNSVKCVLDAGTGIETREGLKPIARIKEGDLVLTAGTTWRPVVWTARPEPYDGLKVRLRFHGHRLSLTPEHPVLTPSGWMLANDLPERTTVLTPGIRCAVCGKTIPRRHDHRYAVRVCSQACRTELAALGTRRGKGGKGRGEDELAEILDHLGIPYFRQATKDGVHTVDFYLPSLRLAVEVASIYSSPQRRRDFGWETIYLAAETILSHPYLVADWMVATALARSRPTLAPQEVTVQREMGSGTRYNFGVAEEESYVAGGIVVHNCRPPDNKLDRHPYALPACRKWLDMELSACNPRVIVALGKTAGSIWFSGCSATEISGLARALPDGTIVVGALHPAYVARGVDPTARASLVKSLERAKRLL